MKQISLGRIEIPQGGVLQLQQNVDCAMVLIQKEPQFTNDMYVTVSVSNTPIPYQECIDTGVLIQDAMLPITVWCGNTNQIHIASPNSPGPYNEGNNVVRIFAVVNA